MGYGEFGGNSSVSWKVDIDDPTTSGKKHSFVYGRDPKNAATFEVSLEYPTPGAAQAELTRLTTGGGMRVQGSKIVFSVGVQALNEDQIHIEW